MGDGFDDINGDGNAQGWEYTIIFGRTFEKRRIKCIKKY